MFSRRPSLRSVAAASFLLAGLLPAGAELAASSPFLPPGGQQVAAPANTAPLELRGVSATGDITMFSIFDPAKKSGTWVRLDESGYDFSVKKYDPDRDAVTIEHQGRTHVLELRASKIASSGNAVAPPPVAGVPPNPVTRNVVATPTTASEAARLADWSAEIQRRRDLRAQANAQTGAGTQTAAAAAVRPPVQATPNPPQNPQGNGNNQAQRSQRRGAGE